jgi:sulfite oxidase
MYSVKMQEYIENTTTSNGPEASASNPVNRLSGNEDYFVYHQGAIPQIDSQKYHLSVKGLVKKSLCLSLEDLREDFPKVTLAASLQGEEWSKQNQMAKWSGIRLRHLLLATGVEPDATHVVFFGLNNGRPSGVNVVSGGAIPIKKALSPEVLLAYEMNEEPISPANGYPLRVIVPGYDGTCSVKWINEINLFANIESDLAEYKPQPANDNSVNVLISRPRDGETVFDDVVVIEGYAIASSGRLVKRVELSTDGGKTWKDGQIHKSYNPWVWCAWESHLRLSPGTHNILVRAWDAAGHMSSGSQSVKVRIVEDD